MTQWRKRPVQVRKRQQQSIEVLSSLSPRALLAYRNEVIQESGSLAPGACGGGAHLAIVVSGRVSHMSQEVLLLDEGVAQSCLRGLTFELRRDRRQDARPGPVKMYAYHRPGPGGLPLGLASNEGLGLSLTGACLGELSILGLRAELTS